MAGRGIILQREHTIGERMIRRHHADLALVEQMRLASAPKFNGVVAGTPRKIEAA
jgi:hypothetical protein